jgi:Putative undecaprenyl diphosphate synthase
VASSLAHVMVVAGTRREWDEFDDRAWSQLATDLGQVVADAGGAWLTVRAYEAGEGDAGLADVGAPPVRNAGPIGPVRPVSGAVVGAAAGVRRHLTTPDGRCTVIIDPVSDGRERFAEAMRHLSVGAPVDEKAVTGVLYDPADVEPDLVLVLGQPTRLPPSLVWELAYSELVFEPIRLAELRPEHLQRAVEEFHGRQRRFGGLDG